MKNKLRITFVFVVAFFALNLIAQNALALTDAELEVQRLQDRIAAMEKNMATMQQELYRNGGKSKSKQPVSDEPLATDDEKSRAMNGKFEELEHSINTLAAKLDKIIADIDFRISALEKKTTAQAQPQPTDAVTANAAAATAPASTAKPVDTAPKSDSEDIDGIETGKQVAAPAAPVAAPATTPTATQAPVAASPATSAKPAASPAKAAYDKAYELFRQSKYDDAEKAFKEFIAGNKGNELVGNAYFWLGESYSSRQNYQSAAVNFLKGYQDFPKGNKAAESLYKLGLAMKGLKKEKEACATFAKMKKEYPSAGKAVIGKVDAERKELKCK